MVSEEEGSGSGEVSATTAAEQGCICVTTTTTTPLIATTEWGFPFNIVSQFYSFNLTTINHILLIFFYRGLLMNLIWKN